jgi:hypothetical protein
MLRLLGLLEVLFRDGFRRRAIRRAREHACRT